jgi:hypothetical protein
LEAFRIHSGGDDWLEPINLLILHRLRLACCQMADILRLLWK